MSYTRDDFIRAATSDALRSCLQKNPPGPNFNRQMMKEDVFGITVATMEGANINLPKSQRMSVPRCLEPSQIAMIIKYAEPVARICCCEDSEASDLDLLGVYQYDGPNAGTYDTSDEAIDRVIEAYNFDIKKRDLDEIKHILMRRLPKKYRCRDRDLVPVNNGLFNYKAKMLEPFTPDKIFLSKSKVNYNPNARNVIIHNPDDGLDWDVESWIAGLSEDPEIVNLFWEILGAIIRPFVRWNKSAWLYSESGNSGKGTLCELMRNLCGRGSYASIDLKQFSERFSLEPLIRANAIIVDENDVGAYLEKSANLKAVITNDAVLIDRKFKEPITYQFFGFMVQCINEYPRVRDRSASFYRRQLFIPFDKCYTGSERPYIKEDYLSRPEVLEYVMFKVLNTNYYKLSEPAACKAMLDDLKVANSPVREFVEDILPQCRWNLLPFTFLYDLYKGWLPKVNPGGTPLGRNTFINELIAAVSGNSEWVCKNKKTPVPTKDLMDCPEPLIVKYSLTDWMNPNYRGPDQKQICRPALNVEYRGLVRRIPRKFPGQGYVVTGNEPYIDPHPITANGYRRSNES